MTLASEAGEISWRCSRSTRTTCWTPAPIRRGAHVHSHNLKSARWSGGWTSPGSRPATAASAAPAPARGGGRAAENLRLTGYRRPDGRFGIRNHAVILPVDDISNAAAAGAAALVKGAIALPHPYGRLQFGEDLELTFRTLAGVGRNPNVAAVVVIAIEPKWAQRVADSIAGFCILPRNNRFQNACRRFPGIRNKFGIRGCATDKKGQIQRTSPGQPGQSSGNPAGWFQQGPHREGDHPCAERAGVLERDGWQSRACAGRFVPRVYCRSGFLAPRPGDPDEPPFDRG